MSGRSASRAESRAYANLRRVASVLNQLDPLAQPEAWDAVNALFLTACAAHDLALAACGIRPYEFDPDPAPPAPAAPLALPLAA